MKNVCSVYTQQFREKSRFDRLPVGLSTGGPAGKHSRGANRVRHEAGSAIARAAFAGSSPGENPASAHPCGLFAAKSAVAESFCPLHTARCPSAIVHQLAQD